MNLLSDLQNRILCFLPLTGWLQANQCQKLAKVYYHKNGIEENKEDAKKCILQFK